MKYKKIYLLAALSLLFSGQTIANALEQNPGQLDVNSFEQSSVKLNVTSIDKNAVQLDVSSLENAPNEIEEKLITSSNYPDATVTYYYESGYFTVNSGSRHMVVRNYPGYNEPTVATYGPGETFYYDRIYNFKDTNHNFTHHYASYVTSSGDRRYVPYGETRNGIYKRLDGLNFTNVIY